MKRKSQKSFPFESANASHGTPAIRHGDAEGLAAGDAQIALNGFPDEEKFAATERAHVVNTLEKHAVLQLVADRARIVMDTLGQLIGGQVGIAHDVTPMLIDGIV